MRVELKMRDDVYRLWVYYLSRRYSGGVEKLFKSAIAEIVDQEAQKHLAELRNQHAKESTTNADIYTTLRYFIPCSRWANLREVRTFKLQSRSR